MKKTTNEKYFTADDVKHTRWYVEAEDTETKNRIYNRYLYSFIDKQIESVLKMMNKEGSALIMKHYSDYKQDLHLHILCNVLPKVKIEKVQAIQNLLWTSIKNKLINMLVANNSRTNIDLVFTDYTITESYLVDEPELSKEEIITKILDRIIELKLQQPIVNCIHFTFLEYLERYIIENDFDASGFKDYCMDKMKIGSSRFQSIAYSLNFKTIAFKSKKEELKWKLNEY